VVFDETNRTALFDRYPNLKVPIISLGEIAGLGNILDPVDGDLAEFQRIYKQIEEGVKELALLLTASRSWIGFSIALSDVPSIEDLARQWRRLEARDGVSFFTSWSWIGTWLSLLPPSIKPQLLQIQRDGRCYGAVIAVRRNTSGWIGDTRHLHLNETGDPQFDCVTIEHNGFVGKVPGEVGGWQALLDWFESGAAEADELSISGVTYDILGPRLGGLMLSSDRKTPAYRVDLVSLRAAGGSVGSILSANSRQQLNRSMRVFASSGPLKLEAAKHVDEALAFFERLKRLHIRSWTRRGQRHGFVYPFVERFHRSLIERCVPQGEVELLRLTAGSRELGYLYNFCRNGVVYAYQSGFDDEDRRLRPGYVAHALAIERSASLGALAYDFMAGSNRLKESFATERYSMRWYTLQRPLLRFRVGQAARAVKQHLLPEVVE